MSSFGSIVSQFSAWEKSTRENRLTGPDNVVNLALLQAYLYAEMVNRDDSERELVGGKYFSDRIMRADMGNDTGFNPGDVRSPTRVSAMDTTNFAARFFYSSALYTQQEILANEGDKYAQFKKFATYLDQLLYTTHINARERGLWAVPHYNNMEKGAAASTDTTTNPGVMMSIPALVREPTAATGVLGGAPIADAAGGTFSTIAGVSATADNYRNHAKSYNTAALDDPSGGLFAAFDYIWLKCSYGQVPGYDAYINNRTARKRKICSNTNGCAIYSQQLRQGNQLFQAGPQDPSYGMPVFKGVPVVHCPAIDNSNLEHSAGTLSSAPYTEGRPRYFFLDMEYLYFVFWKGHKMKRFTKDAGGFQPDVVLEYLETAGNLIMTNPQRQGIVFPG